jgi:hypothetical protein
MRQRKSLIHIALVSVALLIAILSLGMFIHCSKDPTSIDEDTNQLEYVSPEEVGYSSEMLEEARQFAEQSGYAAVMALCDGQVFFHWGEITRNYWCHSIRKPFLSALYGIHVEQGHLDLDATLEDLNIDDIPPVLTDAEKQVTVRDLLKSRSGVYHEAAAEVPSMVETRPERGSHPPGTFYYYNNWDFNALGTIFEQETETQIFEEFKEKIADPVGMEDFDVENCSYYHEPEKSMHPAYLFRMSARDMARFGVLYQKSGIWKGSRIIPNEWITESTTAYSIVDSASGIAYGYMWNVFPEASPFADQIGSPGYYHTGIGVHALVIIPGFNLVIVERYDTDGDWTDPGEVGMELGMMIINARISDER